MAADKQNINLGNSEANGKSGTYEALSGTLSSVRSSQKRLMFLRLLPRNEEYRSEFRMINLRIREGQTRRVTRELEKLVAERGAPEAIRSDNGPEFTSRHFLAWTMERKIEWCTSSRDGRCRMHTWRASTGNCAMSV